MSSLTAHTHTHTHAHKAEFTVKAKCRMIIIHEQIVRELQSTWNYLLFRHSQSKLNCRAINLCVWRFIYTASTVTSSTNFQTNSQIKWEKRKCIAFDLSPNVINRIHTDVVEHSMVKYLNSRGRHHSATIKPIAFLTGKRKTFLQCTPPPPPPPSTHHSRFS